MKKIPSTPIVVPVVSTDLGVSFLEWTEKKTDFWRKEKIKDKKEKKRLQYLPSKCGRKYVSA